MPGEQLQMFGGDWTEKKLEVLQKYLAAYTTALKNQPFELVYIDAFAGTGYREPPPPSDSNESLLFTDLAKEEPQGFLEGSARKALSIPLPFARYVFIEKSASRCEELEELKQTSDLGDRIKLRQGDCNDVLMEIATSWNWRDRRAVLFLDPFGMQVNWETIEAIARTRAVDVWILFPISAVNRLLARHGDIPEHWADALTRTLGTSDWQGRFYQKGPATLIEGAEATQKVCDFEDIALFWNERLASVFADVADNPAMLCNTTGSPLYLFCFAAANPKGAPIAVKIAQHILKNADMKKTHGN